MSQISWQSEVLDYITNTKFAILAYVREDKTPLLRSMGSFALSGFDLYFSSGKDTSKVTEIIKNPQVSFFFEHDNQNLEGWKSVLLLGRAELLIAGTEYNNAIELLSNRNPRFKERVVKGELTSTAIFKLKTREIEYLDY
ncbi:MAG TPA: pyridoxamine 5'-phosphate oxidase family protein, partial [Firmicutes bacterium]|nr:pyridoxamine 5'-phosphate oxidase family protein [Bacillota bacterium]